MTTSLPATQDNGSITVLLKQWSENQGPASGDIVPLIYGELRMLAGHYLRKERGNHTLQPTALVNEAWMRLASIHDPGFQNRKHFYAIAARLMRQILVDHARQKMAEKRGAGTQLVQLNEFAVAADNSAHEYLMLHEALERLSASDPRKGQIVELRYFTGMTIEEVADYLGISVSTVMREQRFAEAWLSRHLGASRSIH